MRSRGQSQKAASSPLDYSSPPRRNASSDNKTASANNQEHCEQEDNKTININKPLNLKKIFHSITIIRLFHFTLVVWCLVVILYIYLSSKVAIANRFISCNTNSSKSQDPLNHQKLRINQSPKISIDSKTDSLNVSIFYSIHIPMDSSKKDTLSVIKEQVQFYKQSTLLKPNIDSFLYYTIITNDEKSSKKVNDELYNQIRNVLNDVNGKEMTSTKVESNDAQQTKESQTLSSLYDHCQSNPSTKVIYMHNNQKDTSHKLLKMSTMSVFTNECLFMDDEIDHNSPCKCNICSGRFSPIPNYHTPGNIFLSKCSYINQLINPNDFEDAMDFVLQNTKSTSLSKQQKEFINDKSNAMYLGTNGHAIKHWVFSHPNVYPCDVYPGLYRWGTTKLGHFPSNDIWKPSLKKGPRFPEMEDYVIHKRNFMSNRKIGNVIPTLGDVYGQKWYYGLKGRLYEWKLLYGMMPSQDSWILDYYNNSVGFK